MSARSLVLAALALSLSATGCAVQAGAGWSSAAQSPLPRVVGFEGRAFAPRSSGPLIGFNIQAGLGESRQKPVHIQTGMLAAGYHFRTPRPFPLGFGGEVAFDLGIGQPAARDIGGTGGYLGLNSTLLYRLFGAGDDEPQFQILSFIGDLAITGRAGLWTAPEIRDLGSPLLVPDVSGQIAFRLTFSTDLANAPAPEDPEQPHLAGKKQ
jgi:hypothetical protein